MSHIYVDIYHIGDRSSFRNVWCNMRLWHQKLIIMNCKYCNGNILLYGIDDCKDTGHCELCHALYWYENGEWKCKQAN